MYLVNLEDSLWFLEDLLNILASVACIDRHSNIKKISRDVFNKGVAACLNQDSRPCYQVLRHLENTNVFQKKKTRNEVQ